MPGFCLPSFGGTPISCIGHTFYGSQSNLTYICTLFFEVKVCLKGGQLTSSTLFAKKQDLVRIELLRLEMFYLGTTVQNV